MIQSEHASWYSPVLLLVLACLGWSGADAQQDSRYAGYEPFPDATVSDRRQQENARYRLALGRLRRVDGRVQPSRSQVLQGRLTRITYAIPEAYDAREVYTFFREQLLAGGQRSYFECEGAGCGNSVFWANNVFDNRVLYGRDENQFYMASSFESQRRLESVSGYAALYVIRRVNGELYAHLDFLEASGEEEARIRTGPDTMLERLRREGSVILTDVAFNEQDRLVDDSGVERLVRMLQLDTLLDVYLVSHLRDEQSLDRLLERSQQRANRLRERLLDAGIDGSRIIARGVGPLAPFCQADSCYPRIEMVLR